MKIEKNKLVKVFWKSEEFEEIPFYFHKINGKTFICPCSYAEDIYAMADRVTNANVLKINSEDYVQHYSTMGGTFEFVLKDDVEVN